MDITSLLLSIQGGKYHSAVIYYTCNPMMENMRRIKSTLSMIFNKYKLSYF